MIKVMVLGLRAFPGVQGGVEKHAEHLYPLLAQMGCEVGVITRSSCDRNTERSWKGVTFHRLWAPKIKGAEAFVHSFLGVVYAGIRRPDILHIHAIGPAIMTPLARFFGLRVVVTHHGADYTREKWGGFAKWILRLGEKWGMKYANERIAISRIIRESIKELYHRDAVIIPNGVIIPGQSSNSEALAKYSLGKGKYVLTVGRIVPEKRHLDLIRAFRESNSNGWKLVIVGDSDHRDAYWENIQSEGSVTPGVLLTGHQSGAVLEQLYANAGLFVLPSSHEGLPIALLEALSYGIPVLASNISPNREIGLPNECYFPLADVKRLAVMISNITTRGLARSTDFDGRDFVKEQYNWRNIATKTMNVYMRIYQQPIRK